MGETATHKLLIELIPDHEHGGFTACIPNLAAYGEGETEDQAIEDLQVAVRGYIAEYGVDDAIRHVERSG